MFRSYHQRQRRRLAAVGEGQRPLGAVGAAFAFERRDLRPVEADADGTGPSRSGEPADIADDGAALDADRFDIDRLGMVEHQPHRIGAAEQRRRRRRRQSRTSRAGRRCHASPRRWRGLVLWRRFPAADWMPMAQALPAPARRCRPWARRPSALPRPASSTCSAGCTAFAASARRRCAFSGAAAIFSTRGPRFLGRRHFFDGRLLFDRGRRGLGRPAHHRWAGLISILACSAIISG